MQTLIKKIIVFCIMILSLSASYGFGDLEQIIIGPPISAPACTTVQAPTEDEASAGAYPIAYDSTNKYRGTKFVYTGTTTSICKVDTWMNFTGSNSHTYILAFYSHDAGNDQPGSVITNGTSDGQDLSGIGGSEALVSWSFSTDPTLTNGTTYWIVIYSSTTDSSHYASWHYESNGTTEAIKRDDDASGTWTPQSGAVTEKFKLYSY